MKKILFALLVSLCLTNFANAEINSNSEGNMTNKISVSDYQKVKNALNNYLRAGKQGKSSVLKPSVYKDAIMYNADNGTVEGGSINALFDYLDNNPAAPEINAEITAIDIEGTIAYVKVESENWHGARYTDMFLLVKDGDDWKILTKVFYTHK